MVHVRRYKKIVQTNPNQYPVYQCTNGHTSIGRGTDTVPTCPICGAKKFKVVRWRD